MKKRSINAAALVISVLSIMLVAFAVYSGISKLAASNKLAVKAPGEIVDEKEPLMEDEGLLFGSISEYEAYLQSQGDADNDGSGEITCFLPGSVPADAVLSGITVDDGGTLFTYYLNRSYSLESGRSVTPPSDNIIMFDPTDTTIDALCQTILVKFVSISTISDTRSFAADLAADIGADYVETTPIDFEDIYKGLLIGRPYSAHSACYYTLGNQEIHWYDFKDGLEPQRDNVPGNVVYYYYPASLTSSEIQALCSVTEHTISAQNNE